jgi:hypothetical protein
MSITDDVGDFFGETIHTVQAGVKQYVNGVAQKELVKIGVAPKPSTPPTIAPPTAVQTAVAAAKDPSVSIPLIIAAGLVAFLIFRRS